MPQGLRRMLPGPSYRPVVWPAPAEVERVAAGMRRRTLQTVVRRRGGYLIQTCSSAEVLATLCLALADSGPVRPGAPAVRRHAPGSVYLNPGGGRDHRLIVSAGHYALALYTALIEIGKLPQTALDGYGEPGSALELIGGDSSPGFEVAGGSLGQGLSQAVGVAMGREWHHDTGRTFVVLSDGEMQEGQTWEALQTAHHCRVPGLTIVVDANGQQVDGDTATVMDPEQLERRLAACGADVTTVDGHRPRDLIDALSRTPDACPAVVVARTDPAFQMPPILALAPHRRHGLWFTSDAEREQFEAALAPAGGGCDA